MAIRVYFMPRIGSGTTHLDARRQKYAIPKSRCIRYGQEMFCMVIADVSAAEHTALVANADVRSLPADLDSTVTAGARTAVVNGLESANVPAQWIVAGMTYRTIVRRLAGIFFLMQGLEERGQRFLTNLESRGAALLDDPISSLPVGVRQGLQSAAAALQTDTSAIVSTTTLRVALATIGGQFAGRSFKARGVDL